jgi:ATP-dependent DNA helicase RecQ
MLAVLTALADAARFSEREVSLQRARDAFRLLAPGDRALITPLAQAVARAESDAWAEPLLALLSREPGDALRAQWLHLDEEQRSVLGPVADTLSDRASGDGGSAEIITAGSLAWFSQGRLDPEVLGAAGQRAVGIRSQATPDELLARFGLAEFRPGQREAVQAALDGRSCLLALPTGAGKSLCYQLPALASDGLTLVVSPLIALIADQHQRLLGLGVRSAMLASTLGEDARRAALAAVGSDAQIVFCAPERFASGAFRRALSRRRIALFVVDEAHCVSEWGHDFRPDYLRLRPVIDELGRPPVMAATATATPKVAQEIVKRLGMVDPVMVRRGFDRPNISFDTVEFAGEGAVARKRATLLSGLRDPANRPAIVYCGTRKDTEAIAATLQGDGLAAVGYHAGMASEARARAQSSFTRGEVDVMVATNAFGMGVDFPFGVRSVWHWAMPASVEAYYQEAGRAGRDGKPARAVMLAMRGDLGRLVQFIRNAELRPSDVARTLQRLHAQAADGVAMIDPRAQDDRDRIALAVAERCGAASLAPGPGGQVAVSLWGDLEAARAETVCREATGRRWDAYQALKAFATSTEKCRRQQLLDHFGDPTPPAPTGRCCDVCDALEWLTVADRAPAARRGRGTPEPTGPPVDSAEFEALKAWRSARADGKPAYTVATNAVLEEVLRRRPAGSAELLEIKGIGPAFVANHGDSLVAELQALG